VRLEFNVGVNKKQISKNVGQKRLTSSVSSVGILGISDSRSGSKKFALVTSGTTITTRVGHRFILVVVAVVVVVVVVVVIVVDDDDYDLVISKHSRVQDLHLWLMLLSLIIS
jgi:hypothetical protein